MVSFLEIVSLTAFLGNFSGVFCAKKLLKIRIIKICNIFLRTVLANVILYN